MQNKTSTLKEVFEYVNSQKSNTSIDVIRNQRNAIRRVYSELYPNSWASIQIKDIELNKDIRKFAEISNKQCSSYTIAQYKSRINRAINCL